MKLLLRDWKSGSVGGVDNEDDGVDTAAIALPHGAETRLSAEIPAFEGYVPFLDAFHVEADCGYGAVGDGLVRILSGQMGGFVGKSERNLEARGA